MRLFRSRNVLGIADETVEFILATCRDTHPNEFLGLLSTTQARRLGIDRDGLVITDVVVVPGTESGEAIATMRDEMIPTPTNASTVGTVHSHPTGNTIPSQQDLATFSKKGNYHIIVGHPYTRNSWACYDDRGIEREIDVLDVELDDEHEDDDFFDFTEEELRDD
ncbi:MAG: Mov34/MPN/PAD-1 family protein [Halobacteria archaeon]|nr:Mov34/MPN/PAD-1 family protein [Halobacteria archaeon]